MADTFKLKKQCNNRLECSKLEMALVVAAKTVCRYKGSSYESAAIAIFERIEAAHLDQKSREQTVQRVLMLVDPTA